MATDTLISAPAHDTALQPAPFAALEWEPLLECIRTTLAGDIEVIEHAAGAQLAHFESGVRVTLEDDALLVSSSYSLLDHEAARVAERMRDLVFSLEMLTDRRAEAVRFDQPDLVAGDMAGRHRVHGYALFGSAGSTSAGSTMRLHASHLVSFDDHARRRNEVMHLSTSRTRRFGLR